MKVCKPLCFNSVHVLERCVTFLISNYVIKLSLLVRLSTLNIYSQWTF